MTELSQHAKTSPIDLLKGWPCPCLLPAAQIKKASDHVLSDTEISTLALLYGPYAGYEPLREQVASWLTSFYNPLRTIGSERICITGGASQNMPCILQVYTDPIFTRNVWMVSPAYFLASRMFEDSGFAGRLRSVPEDQEGIDIAFLKEALQESEEKAKIVGNVKPTLKPLRPWHKIYRHVIYAVPTFSNPSSSTMSLQRREQLVQVAREYDALIITDDVYDQLLWPASIRSAQSSQEQAFLPRVVDVDRYLEGGSEKPGADGFGNAVSNGSFSKIVSPGCRTGWAEGTEKFAYGLSQVGSSWSGGAASQFTATVMSELLKSGDLQQHIFQTLQPIYARRYRNMVSAIETHLVPLGVKMHQSNRDMVGGYFIWLHLPEPLRADNVAVRSADEDLVIAPGSLFGVYGDIQEVELVGKVRVCFAWEAEELLEEGIVRLSRVVRRLQEETLDDQGVTQVRRLIP